ncbi:MAG: hypothetical protein PHR53_06905 [Bacteroidales bacterium]|nr:hypothetical protein [Bacteroidales bacterium]
MKKFSVLLSVFVVVFSMISCAPEVNKEAVADLDSCFVKMNRFNDQFTAYYEDAVITTVDTIEGVTCEYAELMVLANDYLAATTNVNAQIQNDKDLVAQGERSNGYEKSYQDALTARQAEFDAAQQLFNSNMEVVEGAVQVVIDSTAVEQVPVQ